MNQTLRTHLMRGALGSLAFKLSATFAAFGLSIILARLLGVEGFGVYSFCMSVVQMLAVPAMLGGPALLVRQIPAYQARGEYDLLKGVYKQTRFISLCCSALITIVFLVFIAFKFSQSNIYHALLASAPIIALSALLHIYNESIRGLRYILLAQITQLLRPLLFILFLLSIYFLFPAKINPVLALVLHSITFLVLIVCAWIILKKNMPLKSKICFPAYKKKIWLYSALPFAFVTSMQVINKEISVFMLGIFQDAEQVGFFRVVQRASDVVVFGLAAVNMSIAPTLSRLFVQNDLQRVRHIVHKAVLASFLFALPFGLVLIFAGKFILSIVFGPEFAEAHYILKVLVVGQLVNVAMGPVALILNMAGYEKSTARGVAISALLNLILNAMLIPAYSALGAGLASAVSLIFWNVYLAMIIYKDLGITSRIKFFKV